MFTGEENDSDSRGGRSQAQPSAGKSEYKGPRDEKKMKSDGINLLSKILVSEKHTKTCINRY